MNPSSPNSQNGGMSQGSAGTGAGTNATPNTNTNP